MQLPSLTCFTYIFKFWLVIICRCWLYQHGELKSTVEYPGLGHRSWIVRMLYVELRFLCGIYHYIVILLLKGWSFYLKINYHTLYCMRKFYVYAKKHLLTNWCMNVIKDYLIIQGIMTVCRLCEKSWTLSSWALLHWQTSWLSSVLATRTV